MPDEMQCHSVPGVLAYYACLHTMHEFVLHITQQFKPMQVP
jgi:hypothetical protein